MDPTGKLSGRGAYLHEDPACWEAALKGDRLAHALKTQLSPEEREMLAAYIADDDRRSRVDSPGAGNSHL